jgi:hypothetical protein
VPSRYAAAYASPPSRGRTDEMPIQFSISQAPSPVFFVRPRIGRIPISAFARRVTAGRAATLKDRGRAGRQGPRRTRGPRHLATSRLVEVRIARLRSFELRRGKPQVRRSQGVPRAVFLRLAPRRPRWADNFYPPLVTPCRGAGPARLGPPGPAPHLRCKIIPRPPLPALHLETLIRHPSATGRDNRTYILGL